VFDKIESVVARLDVETLDGIPDKPENMTVVQKEPERIEISWQNPAVIRGVLQEFQVSIS
jgi:hypothetical protein